MESEKWYEKLQDTDNAGIYNNDLQQVYDANNHSTQYYELRKALDELNVETVMIVRKFGLASHDSVEVFNDIVSGAISVDELEK